MWRAAWTLVLLSLVGGMACGRRGTPPDDLVMLIESPLGRLDPRFALGSWETRVSRLVAPGLVGLADLGIGPTPGLAESVHAEDGVTYLAVLRPEACFPGGRVVDAGDVRYTFDSVRDPALGSPFRKSWDDVLASVEVVDGRTVRFHLRHPRAPFLSDLEFGIVDRRVAEPLDEAVKAAARQGQPAPAFDPVGEVAGAGPYRIVERSADWVVLARNPHGFVSATMPRIVVRTIRDDNARVLALMGKSADVIENGVTPLVLESLEKDSDLKVEYGRSATLTYLGFNLEDPILADRRVRQAIAQAIDRQRIVAAKYRGRAVLAASLLDPGNAYYNASVRRWLYDPGAARRLLDESGHPDPDGTGPLPRFTLTWKSSAVRFRVALAQVMARQLAEVGIAVEVRPFEFATFLDDVRKGNFQIFSLQITDVVEPDYLRSMLHSARIPTPANSYGGTNRFRYRNAGVDAWLDEGAAVADPGARRGAYAKVQRALAEDLPMFPLWHEDNVVVARRLVEGFNVLQTGRLEGFLQAHK